MSAAATAAGYLYASGRLRGRGAREQEEQHDEPPAPEKKPVRKEIRVAVLREREQPRQSAAPAPKKAPKIEYRTRKRLAPE
ncbi:MAG TPA: hypothetical protein VFR66_12700 [Burkholderiales bacterium]|nr:hypothetical protein [Burkholderiales bacterium]